MKVKDHLGNEYSSIKEMCTAYGVTTATYFQRLHRGATMQDALETPVRSRGVTDHKGNRYKTLDDMCKAYDITPSVYYGRVQMGWSLQKILETPIGGKKVVDHKGNIFYSQTEMAEHYGITIDVLSRRMASGWTLKDALEKPVREMSAPLSEEIRNRCKENGIAIPTFQSRVRKGMSVEEAIKTPLGSSSPTEITDHMGNVFRSKRAMCIHYGITNTIFNYRIACGWSLKDSLETPVQKHAKGTILDHCGNSFISITEMCKYYNMKESSFRYRISTGWSLEDALTMPAGATYLVTDHLGNKYNSVVEMCDKWGISAAAYMDRISRGWIQKDALETPVIPRSQRNCKE